MPLDLSVSQEPILRDILLVAPEKLERRVTLRVKESYITD